MYTSLILFFISLIGIIFMVGRKLTLAQSETIVSTEQLHPFVPDVQKIKEIISKNTKKHSYIIVVKTIRSYVLLENFLKSKYEKIKIIINAQLKKNTPVDETFEKKEASRFLKRILDYKHKIRNIKQKIVEEEKNGKI